MDVVYVVAVLLGALLALARRRCRFEPPGPVLQRAECPTLFAVVDEVALTTGQRIPAEVYLLNEVNAWVTYRGGVLGLGGTPVMGIGLPLLQALSVAEIRAVIAHEFGHYLASDLTTGSLLQRARSAIVRAIAGIRQTFLQEVLAHHGRALLRLAQAVSRRQEFLADAIAARLAGRETTIAALRRVLALTPAYSAYLSRDIHPVLRSGYLPPLASGFSQFVTSEFAAEWMHDVAKLEEESGETDSLDSHPCLKDRVRALERLADVPAPSHVAEDGVLLPNAELYARTMLAKALGVEAVDTLRSIEWDAVGHQVYPPLWRRAVQRYRRLLAGLTPEMVPGDSRAFVAIGSRVLETAEASEDERIEAAIQLFIAAIALALTSAGWTAALSPGCPIALHRGDEVVVLRIELRDRALGHTSDHDWVTWCQRLGISGTPLAL